MKEKTIDDLQDSLTGTTIEHSDSGRENNPDLLQESEVSKADAYFTADASTINEDYDIMII